MIKNRCLIIVSPLAHTLCCDSCGGEVVPEIPTAPILKTQLRFINAPSIAHSLIYDPFIKTLSPSLSHLAFLSIDFIFPLLLIQNLSCVYLLRRCPSPLIFPIYTSTSSSCFLHQPHQTTSTSTPLHHHLHYPCHPQTIHTSNHHQQTPTPTTQSQHPQWQTT